MRLKMFLAVALALVACAGSYMELAARCRCDRTGGSRRAARQERRAARRGYSSYAPQSTPSTPSYNPYDSGVQPLGAAAQPRFRWECNGSSCRLVPVAPQAAVCPPAAPATKTPEPEPTKAEETTPTGVSEPEVIEPPAFENLPDAVQAESDPPPPRSIDPTAIWRPDPPVTKLPGWDD